MRLVRALATVLLLGVATFTSTVCFAQATTNSDLSLSAALTTGTRILPGTSGRLILTIHNNGPNPAPAVGVVTSSYLFGPGETFYLFHAPEEPPCRLDFDDFAPLPGNPAIIVAYASHPGPIPVGGSVSCTLGIGAWPDARGSTYLTLRVANAAVGFADPDPSNNVVSYLLEFEPPSVPATTVTGAVLLLLLLGLMSIHHLRRTV